MAVVPNKGYAYPLGYETEKPEVLERYGIAQLRRAKNKKIN